MKNSFVLFEIVKSLWYNFLYKKGKGTVSMYSALDVARYVVNYANDNNMLVSNLKLQKILYFIQIQFLLIDRKRPCFKDDMEAWAFGPVVPAVYREFKRYGSLSIPKIEEYYDTSNGFWNLEKIHYETKLTESDKKIVEKIVERCDKYSASDLVSITHNQTPWIEARKGSDCVISIDSLLDFIDRYSE